MRKKGQLQIQETILVVFVFVILIILGMVFFVNYQKSSIKEDYNDFQRTKVRTSIITIGDMPELSCSKGGVKEKCIDSLKLIAFKTLSERRKDNYKRRFGNFNITIYQVYPKTINYEECSKDKITDCQVWNIYNNKPNKVTSKIIEKTPISIYYPKRNVYYVGLMVMEAYNV